MAYSVKKFGRILLFGFFLWISVFSVSFIVFPIKQADSILFETIITITLTAFTILFGYIFFNQEKPSIKKTLVVGIIWLMVNIIIDLPLFIFGPMKRPFINYMTDIGFTYLIIPMILLVFSFRSKNTSS